MFSLKKGGMYIFRKKDGKTPFRLYICGMIFVPLAGLFLYWDSSLCFGFALSFEE